MTEYIIFGITFALTAAAQPGPLMAFIVSQTLKGGFRKTWTAAFAPVLSDAPIILLALLLLTNIPVWFASVLQLAGGFFILYLAYGAYKSWKNSDPAIESKSDSANQTLAKAIIVNLLNPNPYIGWSLILGPLLIKGYNEGIENAAALIISFYSGMAIFLLVIIYIFSIARKLGDKLIKIALGLSATFLLMFGLYYIVVGAAELIK